MKAVVKAAVVAAHPPVGGHPYEKQSISGDGCQWCELVPTPRGREGQPFTVGIDVGKYELRAVLRWPDGQFERPWKVANPGAIGALVGLLRPLAQERPVCVALEPSGVYGDPLRQALADARVSVHRVSPKAAHDYAEVFDGGPS